MSAIDTPMLQKGWTLSMKRVHQAPMPTKVCISMGVAEAGTNIDTLEKAMKELNAEVNCD